MPESTSLETLNNFSASRELYELAVQEVIVRPIYSLMNRAKVDSEIEDDTIIWTDTLEAIIPMEKLRPAFIAACTKQTGSFAPNFFDVKNAYAEIQTRELNEKLLEEKRQHGFDPVRSCKEKEFHVTSDGLVNISISLDSPNEQAPCRICRYSDHENWCKSQVALYGEHKPLTVLQSNVREFKKPTAPTLSIEEIAALEAEHNNLVRALVADTEAQKRLFIVFDKGANCFKSPNFSRLTYSFDVVRKKIESYRKADEKRN